MRKRLGLEALEGRCVPATISGRVWLDDDADGVQGAGEGNYNPPVNVFLYQGDTLVAGVTTNKGTYTFTGVDTGTYWLHFTKPAGYSVSPFGQGSDPTKDSDFTHFAGDVYIAPATVLNAADALVRDAGLMPD